MVPDTLRLVMGCAVDVLMVISRLHHVLSTVFGVGATFFLVSMIAPSVTAIGAEGQKFMQYPALRSRMTVGLFVTATLTALSGVIMYVYLFGLNADTAI